MTTRLPNRRDRGVRRSLFHESAESLALSPRASGRSASPTLIARIFDPPDGRSDADLRMRSRVRLGVCMGFHAVGNYSPRR